MSYGLCDLPADRATFVDILQWRAFQQPHDRAYIFLVDGENEERCLTYRELELRARSIGALLQTCVCAGERVLLFFPPGLEYLEAFWGCLYAGVIAVPVYQPKLNTSIERIRNIMLDTQVTYVLTSSKCINALRRWFISDALFAHLEWIVTDEVPSSAAAHCCVATGEAGDATAYIQYTSGTTAFPRGVMISQRNSMHNVTFLHQRLAHPTDKHMVSWLPSYHDMGLVSSVLLPLYAGFPVVLMAPASFIQRPLRWLKAISRYGAATSGGPNFAYELCLYKSTPEQIAALDLSTWSAAFNGSEPIDWVTLENFSRAFARCGFRQEAFYPCYGLAEATLFVAGRQRGAAPLRKYFRASALATRRVEEVEEHEEDACSLVSCGYSAEDQVISIVHPVSLTRCPPGQVGEIWVAGPSVAQSYWHNSEETVHRLHACLADTNDSSFLRTGDLGFFWQGELFVTGRLQNLLCINEKFYYSHFIEQSVRRSHPALYIQKNAIVMVRDLLVMVQEVSRHVKKEEYDEILAAIEHAIFKEYLLRVSTIVLIKQGSIAKTSSGKIKHYDCRQRFLDGTLEVMHQVTYS